MGGLARRTSARSASRASISAFFSAIDTGRGTEGTLTSAVPLSGVRFRDESRQAGGGADSLADGRIGLGLLGLVSVSFEAPIFLGIGVRRTAPAGAVAASRCHLLLAPHLRGLRLFRRRIRLGLHRPACSLR